MKKEKRGVLLVNLGSPNSTKVSDVRAYLREFLMDKNVIDFPYLLRYFLVNCIIAPFRASKSAEAYEKIWWKEGSPLKVISERLTEKVQKKTEIPVYLAMRYAQPSIQNVMQKMYDEGITEIHVIPLYPQYAMSTTQTVIEKCEEVQQRLFPEVSLSFEPPFYNNPKYIDCLVESIEEGVGQEVDLLLFSYHGVPERHIYKTDDYGTCELNECCFKEDLPCHAKCYRYQCYKTTELTQKAMGLSKDKIFQSFQSRLGKDPWLQPYTDKTLEELPSKGKKKIAVIAPAFVLDCLETLEEINMEGREEFMENGGEKFIYIPCLNDREIWVDFLVDRIHKWVEVFL